MKSWSWPQPGCADRPLGPGNSRGGTLLRGLAGQDHLPRRLCIWRFATKLLRFANFSTGCANSANRACARRCKGGSQHWGAGQDETRLPSGERSGRHCRFNLSHEIDGDPADSDTDASHLSKSIDRPGTDFHISEIHDFLRRIYESNCLLRTRLRGQRSSAKDVLQWLVGNITSRVHGDLDRYGCGDSAC